MTALATALRKVMPAPALRTAELHGLAAAFLKQRKFNIDRAAPDFIARVRADGDLLAALAHDFLNRVVQELQDPSGGHRAGVAQGPFAPGNSFASDRAYDATQMNPIAGDGRGGGQIINHSHQPPYAAANPARTAGIAEVQRHVAKTLFDTVLIRGNPIGDLTFNQARSCISFNKRELRILKFVIAKAGVPVDPNEPLRKIVKLAVIESAIAQAGGR